MLDKTYRPETVETRQYEAWEASGAFAADPESGKRALHDHDAAAERDRQPAHGARADLHVQDILIRFERMRGRDALWQPGTDHAGIATQIVVENQLAERQINSTTSAARSSSKRVWEWKEESGGTITRQLRRLGASADWARERFTMDAGLSAAVRRGVRALYGEGLIYRDKRLVNWDPVLHTAISDLEVDNARRAARSGTSATRSRASPAATSSSRRRGRRRCSATPASRCIPTTSATPIWSASRCGCRWSAA